MLHWLVGVKANYNYGMTLLYALSGNEEVEVHKEQDCGTTCGHKCGKNIVNPTHWCDPHTDVIHQTLVGEKICYAWMVWSQPHPGVIYNIHAPFIKYASCTCEWALHGNLCKH